MRLFDPIRATPLGAFAKLLFFSIAAVDIGIVGFPKCGNTWYSALIRNLLIDAYRIEKERMDRLFVSDNGPWPFTMLPRDVKRIYQSHCMPFPFESGIRGTKEELSALSNIPVVVLIREPKDALVSYFMHLAYREGREIGALDDFVHSPIFGIPKFVTYYNLISEYRNATNAPTQIRRYEDLWSNTPAALTEDCKFMGIEEISPELLGRVVDACGFENMRKMETATAQQAAIIPGLFQSENRHPQAYKVRKGGIGNWQEHISKECAEEVDAYVKRHLDPRFHITDRVNA